MTPVIACVSGLACACHTVLGDFSGVALVLQEPRVSPIFAGPLSGSWRVGKGASRLHLTGPDSACRVANDSHVQMICREFMHEHR